MDVVILGFYRGWRPDGYAPTATLAMRKVVKAIKALNPKILIGQYTILSVAYDDPNNAADQDKRDKVYASKWWLLNTAGRKVQWMPQYRTWEVNLTTWSQADASGRRRPQWLAEREHSVFCRDIPEFDFVYLDDVGPPHVTADWNLDGKNDDRRDPGILSAHYAGHLAEWNRLRELAPRLLLVGNTDNDLANPQWRGQLDGGFLEAQMGWGWSLETRAGWGKMMERYSAVLKNTRPPKIVGFNIQGSPTDYRFFRYGYTSCLLDDGYFSFTDKSREYSSVPWVDEYDHKLGYARSDVQPQGNDPGGDRQRPAADVHRLGADRCGRRFHRRHGRADRGLGPPPSPDPAEEPRRERGAEQRHAQCTRPVHRLPGLRRRMAPAPSGAQRGLFPGLPRGRLSLRGIL